MLHIRPAVPADVPLILSFVRELAEYEREPEAVVATEDDLLRDGFGAQPRFHCAIAEWDREPAGFILFFYNYSTWEGRAGLYLEDLYVRPAYRKRGIGRAFFSYLAERAVRENLGRVVWQVLDWNQPAIDFYQSLGAKHMQEWNTMRLTGPALLRVAGTACEPSN
jgi:GNAT superfamily N-acetyltransferase